MHKRKGVFLLLLGLLFAVGTALAQDDVKSAPACIHCGMDRTKFAHSRMLVTYDDGSTVGTCSLHCLALDLVINIDKTPVALQVGEYTSKRLIDAETAFWVKGGNRPGVMTNVGLWAFANKVYAEKYIRERGGELITFEQAMQAAYANMYTDTLMIRDKRNRAKHNETIPQEHPGQADGVSPVKRRTQAVPSN